MIIALGGAGSVLNVFGQGVTAFVVDLRVDTALAPMRLADSALAARIGALEHDSLSKAEMDTLKWQIYREFAEVKELQVELKAQMKIALEMLQRR